jgi:geranylgeranyl pyrophosphate synthase
MGDSTLSDSKKLTDKLPKSLSPREKISLVVGTLKGLNQVESIIDSKFDAASPLLNEISKYLFTIGGKRIRPVLCVLIAQSLGGAKEPQRLHEVAAGIELIHMATLLHDDIIDRSPLRRHEASPWVKYGTPDTLITGDFLLTRAFSLCARLDRFIIDKTEVACIELTEGEIDERPLSVKNFTINASIEIARKKTGSLFRLAGESAGYLCSHDTALAASCGAFGEALGISFQILDDILDVISTEDLLGKKAGIDLIEKKPSAINVLWLETKEPLAQSILRAEQEPTTAAIDEALAHLRNHPVIHQARALAKQYVDKAIAALNEMECLLGKPLETKSKEALLALTQYVIDRME